MNKELKDGLLVIGGVVAAFLIVVAACAYGLPLLIHSSAAWDKYLYRAFGS